MGTWALRQIGFGFDRLVFVLLFLGMYGILEVNTQFPPVGSSSNLQSVRKGDLAYQLPFRLSPKDPGSDMVSTWAPKSPT